MIFIKKKTVEEIAYNLTFFGGQGSRLKSTNNVFVKQNVQLVSASVIKIISF